MGKWVRIPFQLNWISIGIFFSLFSPNISPKVIVFRNYVTWDFGLFFIFYIYIFISTQVCYLLPSSHLPLSFHQLTMSHSLFPLLQVPMSSSTCSYTYINEIDLLHGLYLACYRITSNTCTCTSTILSFCAQLFSIFYISEKHYETSQQY